MVDSGPVRRRCRRRARGAWRQRDRTTAGRAGARLSERRTPRPRRRSRWPRGRRRRWSARTIPSSSTGPRGRSPVRRGRPPARAHARPRSRPGRPAGPGTRGHGDASGLPGASSTDRAGPRYPDGHRVELEEAPVDLAREGVLGPPRRLGIQRRTSGLEPSQVGEDHGRARAAGVRIEPALRRVGPRGRAVPSLSAFHATRS